MILISAGHHPGACGASHEGFTEYPETQRWAEEIAAHLMADYALPTRVVPTGTLREKVEWINDRCEREDDPCIAIEIHFNSYAGSHKVSGCEALYFPGSAKGKALATKLQSAMEDFTVGRGVKEGWYQQDRPGVIDFYGDVEGDEKPLYFLEKTACPAVIIEPEFIQNVDWIKDNRSLVCQALAEAIYEFKG